MQDQSINRFLPCDTPDAWVQAALVNLDVLLLDHANCEKKAASTAMALMFRYAEHEDLSYRMSRLAREELRHFEQVQKLMGGRGIRHQAISASRYAAGLRQHIRTTEPERLVDTLIVGAFIEARSCERFEKLVPVLDPELAKFYQGLCASEARHFQHYLELAQTFAKEDLTPRVELFAQVEQSLVETPDEEFRFHSGPPMMA